VIPNHTGPSHFRLPERVVFSTDDLPVTILYPSPMTASEIDDLEDFLKIWVRNLRRRSQASDACDREPNSTKGA
jgi:hypothetical protein